MATALMATALMATALMATALMATALMRAVPRPDLQLLPAPATCTAASAAHQLHSTLKASQLARTTWVTRSGRIAGG